jgi:hypothetical protein
MSSSQSSSSNTSPVNGTDLFKKFKLKHHRTKPIQDENDDSIDMNNSDEWPSQSSTPELHVDSHFERHYHLTTQSCLNTSNFGQHLLTPDIDELQRKENELVQSLNATQQQQQQQHQQHVSSTYREHDRTAS